MRQLRWIVLLAVVLSATPSFAGKDKYDLQIYGTDGAWETVAKVTGFYDNQAACAEVVEGLVMVARKHGRMVRTYRCTLSKGWW